MSLVIDSGIFIAYESQADENHLVAKELFKRIEKDEFGSIFLLDYVFDEVLTQIASRRGKNRAVAAGKWLMASEMDMHFISSAVFEAAWQIFKKSSELSFTDCVIAAFAREKNAAIATFDGHFAQFKDLRIIS